MKATGVALHYFDAGAGTSGRGSDKFYRIYLYKSTHGGQTTYHVVSHWGRDGAAGQDKEVVYDNWVDAKNYAVKLGDSKLRKGYEWLGEQEIEYQANNLTRTGETLLKATGRTPTKMNGFALVIQEEADLMELLMA
jgi:predicted DNA-binding WGR domain protein